MKKYLGNFKLWVMALTIALFSSFMVPAPQGDVAGVEIPVSKNKISQTIKHRLAYTVSYNHDTREPNWVAWTLTREHASGSLPRGKFQDDEDMPSPKGTISDYFRTGFDKGHMCPAGDNKWSQRANAF